MIFHAGRIALVFAVVYSVLGVIHLLGTFAIDFTRDDRLIIALDDSGTAVAFWVVYALIRRAQPHDD